MAFTLPTFNLPVNLWHDPGGAPHNPIIPPVGPPDIAGVLANVSLGRRVISGTDSHNATFVASGVGIDVLWRIAMFPAGTDVRGPYQSSLLLGDVIEIPAGSGAFYLVGDVADMAKGFTNEHRLAWVTPTSLTVLPSPLP